jgi:hypothetical protein
MDLGIYQLNNWIKEKEKPGKTAYGYKITKKKLFNELQGLIDTEKVVYIALRLFADRKGYCYPSMRYLGEILGHDKNTIQKYIHSLKKKGFLKIENRWGKKGKAYGYQLLK